MYLPVFLYFEICFHVTMDEKMRKGWSNEGKNRKCEDIIRLV